MENKRIEKISTNLNIIPKAPIPPIMIMDMEENMKINNSHRQIKSKKIC
jgi:hypothetical protein